jgi:hypothetical protein
MVFYQPNHAQTIWQRDERETKNMIELKSHENRDFGYASRNSSG